ncbi:hypothetical protein KSP40_PGU016265 [Platanthera guangdongensis]|uniref:phosphoglycerate kinase n=1 Tax=Platanthera guangdongensis TaxID=2320717 RepID=A0ABR2LXV1_9ASPA
MYVNDAFGTAHRAHASTEGVTKFLKPSVAGFLQQKSVELVVRPNISTVLQKNTMVDDANQIEEDETQELMSTPNEILITFGEDSLYRSTAFPKVRNHLLLSIVLE